MIGLAKNKSINSWFVLLLCAVSLLLSGIGQTKTYFLWDSHDMFELFETYEVNDLTNIELLSLSGHVSYSFTFLGFLLTRIFHSALTAQAVYGKLLLVVAIYGFWKLIDFVLNDQPLYLKVLLCTVYGFSPYLCGMSTYSYLDFAVWCILPLLTYELYAAHSLLHAGLVAVYFVFLKETAVITYFSLVAGIYAVECFEKKKILFRSFRYAVYVLPCILWSLAYFFVGHWQGGGFFGIDFQYILSKTKAYLFVNFNWFFLLLSALVLFRLVQNRKYAHYLKYYIPTLFSCICYYLFSILFITVNHPRYIDGMISQIYFLASFFPVVCLSKQCGKSALLIAEAGGMILSCYLTVDPMMYLCFEKVNVGTAAMITTSQVLSDGMVYNRQYQSFGYATDLAFEEICEDSRNIIYIPAGNEACSWFFDAMGFYRSLSLADETEYVKQEPWDQSENTRMTSRNNAENICFDVHIIRNDHLIELRNDQTGYFVYMGCYGQEKAEDIKRTMKILAEDEFEHNGWIVKRIAFRMPET